MPPVVSPFSQLLIARNTTAGALTASAGTPHIPANFYHWEWGRGERESHDRTGRIRGGNGEKGKN